MVEGTQAELEPIVVSAQHRGRGIGRELAEAAIAEARSRGLRAVVARPVGRNDEAIRFFHACGLDVLDHVQLMLDLVERDVWRPAETLAGYEFRA